MAEKKIIQLNQTGNRVQELLDQIDNTYEETRSNAETAITKATSTETTVSELNNKIGEQELTLSSHESRITTVEAVAAAYDLTYANDILTLWKEQDGVRTEAGTAKIVSAVETDSSVITVTRISPASSTVTLKEPGVIEYNVESLQDGVETGDITVTWKVNNTVVLDEIIKQGNNTFSLDGRVAAGNNGITATFVDSIGTSYTARWSVDVVDMYITSTFNDTTTYSGNANISFTAYGIVNKTIYILLNGEKVYETDIATSGIQSSYILPHQPHGAHAVEIYCKATMNNGREIESEHLHYDVMFVDEGNLTPIIRWPLSNDALVQFKATTFEYSVYTPNSLTSEVKLYIDGEQVSTQVVDRTEQTWTYKSQTAGENIEFKIKTGEVEKTRTFNVEKIKYDISPVPGVVFDFNPTGKTNNDIDYDSWTDGKYSLSVSDGFDWINGGWKQDENDDTYFCVKAGTRAILNFPIFETVKDTKETGKNIKFIFKTTNNRAIKDTAISCMTSKMIPDPTTGEEFLSQIGIEVGTQEANLYASTKNLEVQYVENEKLELEFNIWAAGDRKSLMMGLIDADPVRVIKYDGNASFNTRDYQPDTFITIGNDTCDVHIYRIKCYNTELSDTEIIQNFIADATNSDEMISRYERNDILDTTKTELDYNKLSTLYPDLRIILITCPRFTFDKDDKVKGCTVQHIKGGKLDKHNWTAGNVQIKGQGTSSNEYGTSARNIDIKLNKIVVDGEEQDYKLTYRDENGVHMASDYAMTDNSYPVDYFNIKVNVASSENANNACLADRFFRFNPYKRAVRELDARYRDTMEFHPCVIFLKELGADTEYGNQEFEDTTNFHFYACGDFGNSKKNHKAFGMDVEKYDNYLKAAKTQETDTPVDVDEQPLPMPTEAIIEISNNSAAGCRFKFADGWTEILPDVDPTPTWNEKDQKWEYLDVWGGDVVEFRYPEDLFDAIENKDNKFTQHQIDAANRIYEGLKTEVRRLWNWVASTDTTTATNNPFDEAITYGEKTPSGETIYYDNDSVEYRKAKFKNEYTQYFEPQSLLYNYLFTDRYLMIDNRAKNVFLHTVDGLIWDLCFDYDNDTSLGCDNRGTLKYEYYYEDTDKFGSENVYNAADSVLWCNVRDCLSEELGTAYRANSFYTAKGTITDFNTYQAYKPERLEMFDMRRKYIRPYTDGHYAQNIAEGKMQSYEQYLPMLNGRKKYQRQAFETYREAYTNSKYQVVNDSKALSFRAKADGSSTISITPYCWLYVHVDYDGPDFGPIRTEANQSVTVTIPIEKLDDTNTHIYHPEWIKAVDGLDQWYIRNANFDNGTRLTKLILGSDAPGYENKKDEDHTLSISNAGLLEELNVCGWKMPHSWDLNLATNSNLKTLKATNANISSITFAKGGLVEEVKVDSFSAISAVNLMSLQTFEVKSLAPVTKLRIENTPIISSDTFLEQCTSLLRLRLIGIDWSLADATLFDRFIVLGGLDENGNDLNKIVDDKIVPGGSVVAGKAFVDTIKESQLLKYETDWPNLKITFNNQIEQHIVTYLDWDGTVLYEAFVDEFGLPLDPVAEELISIPTKESSQQYTYEFDGWIGDLVSEVTGPRTLTAKYKETLREYTVRWWKRETDKEPIYTRTYKYGEDAVYRENFEPLYNDGTRVYSLFSGWDKSTSYITEELDVYAQWESGATNNITTETDTTTLSAAQIYNLVQKDAIETYFADEYGVPNGSRVKVEMGFRPNFTNLNEVYRLDKPIRFDGSNVVDTNIMLFDEDKDWTLLIDGKFANTGAQGSLVSCYNENRKAGLQLSYNGANPTLTWSGNLHNSSVGLDRDMYVIRHKKGETSISVFTANQKELEVEKTQINSSILPSHQISLTLGATKNASGKYSNYAVGMLFNVVVWSNYLGDSDCERLASWTWDSYLFDTVGFGGYDANETGLIATTIDLFAAQLLPIKKATEMKENEISFFNSGISEWLENRFFKSLSTTWKKVIKTTHIAGLKYNINSQGNADVLYSNQHFWLPAAVEISSAIDWQTKIPFSLEGNLKSIYSSSTTRTFAYNAAMKEPNPSTNAELQAKEWCYITPSDPRNNNGIQLENGDVWNNTSNSTYHIYKDGEWYEWNQSNPYFTRTIKNDGSPNLYYLIWGNVQNASTTTDATARGILPCFSLSKN